MRKKVILIVFWDLDIGGIQSLIRDMILYVLRTQTKIVIKVLIKNNTNSHILDALNKNGFTDVCYPNLQHIKNRYLRQIYFFLWVAYMYIKIFPDYCLTFLDVLSIYMIVLKFCIFWRHTKIILNENVLTSTNNQLTKKTSWFWDICIRMVYPFSHRIIVPSNACKRDLISKYYIPKSKINVCYNWTLMKEVEETKKEYDLIYIGRFEKEKNPISLIHLLYKLKQKNPDISLCLVGKGIYKKQMQEKIRNLKLENNAKLLGYRADVNKLLGKSKILITTTHNEGFPVSMLEAGIQKIPCVSTRFTGVEEIISHNKTGFICDTQEDMMKRVEKLLKDDAMRRALGLSFKKKVGLRFGEHAIRKFLSKAFNVI